MQIDLQRVMVTGGAGFVGSAVVRELLNGSGSLVLNIDKLTYAGNLDSLKEVDGNPRYYFANVDICDSASIHALLDNFRPNAIIHLAAESHVDRSIDAPDNFIETNLVGTYRLLEETRIYWESLNQHARSSFCFVHVSTDEVFGSAPNGTAFNERTPYNPHSPYSASKAGADHLVRAWYYTYGLPTIVTNCSNNYGPYQFPEKLIPLTILNALEEKPIGVYGKGLNVRDWLHVEDHACALVRIARSGKAGETYLIGGASERPNIDVVQSICSIIDELQPSPFGPRERLIQFVADRPGHDMRYAIDHSHFMAELGWRPQHSFETGLRTTVQWYLENAWWWQRIRNGTYQGERLGLRNASDLMRAVI